MRYNGNDYGARMRDSRGRYMGEYGRRGVPGSGRGRYRGQDYIDDIYESYGNYSEGKETYGHDEKSLEYMLKSVCQFMKMLKEDADSQQEIDLIREYSRKIGEM